MASTNAWRASSSVGLGGTVPPGRMLRVRDIPEGCTIDIRSVVCGPARNWVIPFSFCERLKTLLSPGLRMSSPTMTTLLPSSERLMARLVATNVFLRR